MSRKRVNGEIGILLELDKPTAARLRSVARGAITQWVLSSVTDSHALTELKPVDLPRRTPRDRIFLEIVPSLASGLVTLATLRGFSSRTAFLRACVNRRLAAQ